jgi:uncharacterized protein YjiS (DUF1127 family)
MTTTLTTPAVAEITLPSAKSVLSRIAAAVAAAMARARARHEYRRLMECDDIMRDVGLSRDEVRRALMHLDDRA